MYSYYNNNSVLKFVFVIHKFFYLHLINNNNDIIPYKSRPMRRFLGKIGALYFISYI